MLYQITAKRLLWQTRSLFCTVDWEMFPNLTALSNETKLARVKRKQVLLPKGLSWSSAVGMHLYFHFLHNNNVWTMTTSKILLKIDTSVYNFIISQQGCYNQEYLPRSRPSHEHLLLAKISQFTHVKEILKPSFNHVYSPFYLTTSYQINIVNNFCLKNVSISIGVWKMIAAWLQKGEKT